MFENNVLLLGAAGIFPFILNLLFTPLLLKLAHHNEWYDDVDHRKIHTGDIPRIGGVGIFITAIITILIGLGLQGRASILPGPSFHGGIVFLIGLTVIHAVGLLDDFANLRPLYKLYGQVLATLVVIVAGYSFKSIYLPIMDIVIPLGFFGHVLTFFWILGVTNAVNLIDGLDGLSGTISAFGALFLGIGAVAAGNYLAAIFAFALFGSLLGFLVYNLPPAKLFMGDSGSMFLGYFLSTLPLFAFAYNDREKALPFAMTLVLIPVLDTVGAIIRRKRKNTPFHAPDKEHLHHKLLNFGWSNKTILVIISVASIVLGVPAYLWVKTDSVVCANVLLVLWILGVGGFMMLHRAHRSVNPY